MPTALVTGAAGGIGTATVRALSTAGFMTYAGVRRPGDAAHLAGPHVREVVCDVTDDDSMCRAVAVAGDATGGVDVLVNNAGIAVAGPLEELGLDTLRHQLEVNVVGVVRMTQLVLPGMRARGSGRIVTVGSVGGLFAAPGAGGYHMSKYAIEAYADVLRAEMARFGIKAVLLEPTGVRTGFVDAQLGTLPDTGPDSPYFAFKANMDAGVRKLFAPGSRAVIEPERVARVVVRAAIARRPRTRYKIGGLAHVLPRLRRVVGDRAWDVLAQRQFAAQ